MIGHIFRSPLRRARLWGLAVMFLVVGVLAANLTPPVAAQEHKPDPAGIPTGDKNNAIDAAGTSFVVSAPTDTSAPDYADKKKAFDEYQAQASKEPLAVKLADDVGHVRIATNFAWTL